MKLTEKAIEMANVCLENNKIMINKRVEQLLLEPHCDFLPLLEFESASCDSSFLHTSENEKCPCVMGFEVKKGKREALGCKKEPLSL